MARWTITSSAGVDLGEYAGETAAEALDALARDAGYRDQADATERGIAPFAGSVVRVAHPDGGLFGPSALPLGRPSARVAAVRTSSRGEGSGVVANAEEES